MEKFRVDDGGRECTTCHTYKPWDKYTKMKAGAYGKVAKCKTCNQAQAKAKKVPKRVQQFDDNGRNCSKCKIYRPWAEYAKDKHSNTGYTHRCKVCAYAQHAEWKANNPEAARAASVSYREANLELTNERSRICAAKRRAALPAGVDAQNQKAWRNKNRGHHTDYTRAYRSSNREKILENARKHREDFPHLYAAWDANKRAKRVKRYVTWADQNAIADVYAQAKFLTEVTGVQHHVDHIYPLQGKTVSGLHVHNNLRAIPAEINASKSNNLDPEHLPSDVLEELGVEPRITDQTTVIRVSGKRTG